MDLPPGEATALAEVALKERIAKLQKRIDDAVKKMVADGNHLHRGQTPVSLAKKPLVVRKAPKGKFTLVVSMIHALQALDGPTLTKLATAAKRNEQIALIGPFAVRQANQARGVSLTAAEMNARWLNKELTKAQREKAHAALNDSWKATAKVNGRREGRLDTPAKFLDYVIGKRQAAKQAAATQPRPPDGNAINPLARIWFSDKRTMWFHDEDGNPASAVVSWRSTRPGSTQFRLPGVLKKPTLSTFAKARGYSLDEITRLSDAAQLAADTAAAKEQKDSEAQAEMHDSALFDVDIPSGDQEAPYAA